MKNQSCRMQFFDCAPRLIHGLIGVRRSSRIGICDRDPAKTLAANFARALALRPFRIKEIIVFVRVSMRPAIHGYGSDIVRWIESAFAKNTRELITNISFERNIRDQFARVLGEGGFDPANDITAITVNRWPHGYAYEYNYLFDPEWPKGESPCEIGGKRFGRIAIANSDAGAAAYTDQAMDQAWRAVEELHSV